MFAKAALVLAVFVGAPALSFLVEMIGCVGREPLFGVMCGHNAVYVVGPLTVILWFVLGGIAFFHRRGRSDR
jgi:hypothetical protein